MRSNIVAIYPDGSVRLFSSESNAAKELGINGAHMTEVANGTGRHKTIKGYRFRWPTEDEVIAGKAIYQGDVLGRIIKTPDRIYPTPYGEARPVTRWVILTCPNCNRAYEFDYDAAYVKSIATGGNHFYSTECPRCKTKGLIALDPPTEVNLESYLHFRYTNE